MGAFKHKSRINALFPKAFQSVRLFQQNLFLRDNRGLDLSPEVLGNEAKAFTDNRNKSGESFLRFPVDLSAMCRAEMSSIADKALEYVASPGLEQQSNGSKLLLLLSTIDFLFRLEKLKVNLTEQKRFFDPENYWNNFKTNIIDPLKQDSLALMLELIPADQVQELKTLIQTARSVASRWIDNQFPAQSHTRNRNLLTAAQQIVDPDLTKDEWDKLLKPLHERVQS